MLEQDEGEGEIVPYQLWLSHGAESGASGWLPSGRALSAWNGADLVGDIYHYIIRRKSPGEQNVQTPRAPYRPHYVPSDTSTVHPVTVEEKSDYRTQPSHHGPSNSQTPLAGLDLNP